MKNSIKLNYFLLLIPILIASCSGVGAEQSPVSLPIPFSGSLTAVDAQPFVEVGPAIETCPFDGNFEPCRFALLDPNGCEIGDIFFNVASFAVKQVVEGIVSLEVDVTLTINNVCMITAKSEQVKTIIMPDVTPSITQEDCSVCTGVADGQPIVTGGIGEAAISDVEAVPSPQLPDSCTPQLTEAFQSFDSCQELLGGVLEYRFKHQNCQLPDGKLTFCQNDDCAWLVHPPKEGN